MRQALHIFRKDVRHLRLEILISLATVICFTLTTAFRAQSSSAPETAGVAATLLTYLLPLTWCALIARLIYAEPLCGDRQFWVTRPYSIRSLVGAKALFIAAFVNLPMLIGDFVILRAYGFEIGPALGGLLWTQVLLTAALVLPIAALCAITAGFTQLIAVAFLLVLVAAGWDLTTSPFGAGEPWLAMEWTRSYAAGLVVALASVAILVRQYGRRGTASSRLVAGGAVLSVFLVMISLPWTTAFAVQSRLSTRSIDASGIHISLNPDMKWAARVFVSEDKGVDLQIPLRITGIPAPLELRTEGIDARIEGPGGRTWRAGRPWTQMRPTRDFTSFYASVEPEFYDKVKNDPVRISGSVYLTLYGNPRRTLIPVGRHADFLPTPGVGLCSAERTGRGIVLNCRSVFRSRPDLVRFDVTAQLRPGAPPMSVHTLFNPSPVSYSPFPADANLNPVTQSMQIAQIFGGPLLGVSVLAVEPVAHIRREFEITGVRLADYEVRGR